MESQREVERGGIVLSFGRKRPSHSLAAIVCNWKSGENEEEKRCTLTRECYTDSSNECHSKIPSNLSTVPNLSAKRSVYDTQELYPPRPAGTPPRRGWPRSRFGCGSRVR